MARKKRERTAAEQRRDEFDDMVRRCLALVGLYQELMESFLAADAFDVELARRMISVRETCLLMIEHAMPVPIDVARAEEVATKSRAVH